MRWYRFLSFPVALGFLLLAGHQASSETLVTLAVDNTTLRSFAEQLTRASGLRHRVVGKEAGTQRVALFCKDQPAAAVRQALSDTIGWTWVPETHEGQVTYTLVKGVKLSALERSLREQETRGYLEAVRKAIRNAQNPGRPEDTSSALDLQTRDPRTARLFVALGELSSQQLETLVAGKPLSGATNAWPAGVLRQLVQWSKESGGTAEGVIRTGDLLALSVPRDPGGRPECVQFTHARGKRELAQMRLALTEWVRDEGGGKLAPDTVRLRELIQKNPRLGKPLPTLPALKWPAETPTFVGWQLRDISRRTDFPVVADVYPDMEHNTQPISLNRAPYEPPANSGRSLYRVLNSIGEQARYHWDLQDGWVILRYRDWYWEPLRPSRK